MSALQTSKEGASQLFCGSPRIPEGKNTQPLLCIYNHFLTICIFSVSCSHGLLMLVFFLRERGQWKGIPHAV